MATKQSAAAAVIEHLERWLAQYVTFPQPEQSLVVAVWIALSFGYRRMFAVPYLHVTGKVPGCGKSTVLELIAWSCHNGWFITNATAAGIFYRYHEKDGDMVPLWDEAEKVASERKTDLSEVLDAGYRKGAVVPRRIDGQPVDISVFGLKGFASLGDLSSTVASRSIVIPMALADPTVRMVPEQAFSEGAAFRTQLEAVFTNEATMKLGPEYPEWLHGRDSEIWGAMFGVAKFCGLSEADTARLQKYAARNAKRHSADKVSTHSASDIKAEADKRYARQLLADVRRVLRAGETKVFTAALLDRLLALPTGGWDGYRGDGLSPLTMSNLLELFTLPDGSALGPEKQPFKLKGEIGRGYAVDKIVKAAEVAKVKA